MKKKYYLPTTAPERKVWLNNFAQKIAGYAASFGISPAEVTAIVAMALFYAYIVDLVLQVKGFKEDLTKYLKTLSFAATGTPLGPIPTLTPAVPPAATQAGIFTFIAGIVKRIKSNTTNYTQAIGEDLRIIGDEQELDLDNYKTTLTAKVQLDGVKIVFTKKGVDAVNIYSNPIGDYNGTTWELLGTDFHSPYLDSRPLAVPGVPENRRYMGRGVIDDVEIGLDSDIVKVTFSPATIGSPVTT